MLEIRRLLYTFVTTKVVAHFSCRIMIRAKVPYCNTNTIYYNKTEQV